MRKFTLMLALVFSVAAANSFAADKTDKDKGKSTKCSMPGKCCKKETKATDTEKAKADKDKKAA